MPASSGTPTAFYCSSPSWGGLEMNVLRLARRLAARGTPMTLLLREGTPLHREAARAGLPVIAAPPHGKYLDLPAARKVSKLVAGAGARILFGFHRDDLDLLSWAKVFSGSTPALVHQQHMQLGVSRRDPLHTFRYSRFDAWIAPLDYLREEVLAKTRIPAGKIRVIPLGIEPAPAGRGAPSREEARNFFGVPAGGTLFGMLGRIEPGKGQGFVVRAVKHLRERGHDARLLVVGDPTIEPGGGGRDHREELRKGIRELGLSGVAWLHPHVGDTRPFFAAVDAVVMAAPAETYGMVTLEAMAAGTPVIGTDAAGTREILEGGRWGLLYRPGDEADFCRCAEGVILGNFTGEMLFGARRRARETFSADRECAMIEALIAELTGRPGP